jgi:membrane protein
MFVFLRRFLHIHVRALAYFRRINCHLYAGAMAFFTLLSLVPISLLAVEIFSHTPYAAAIGARVHNYISQHLLVASAEHAQEYLDVLINSVHHLSVPLLGVFAASSVMLFINIESVFNRIWQVHKGRYSFKSFCTYLIMLLCLPICLSVLYVLHSYLHHFSLPMPKLVHLIPHYLNMSAYFSFAFVLALLYYFFPSCKVSFRAALLSGLFISCYFNIAKFGFNIYLKKSVTYSLVYGTLAFIPVFMLWTYITWLIILFGVTLSFVMSRSYFLR